MKHFFCIDCGACAWAEVCRSCKAARFIATEEDNPVDDKIWLESPANDGAPMAVQKARKAS